MHEMKLKEQPFTAIREGRKRVELRLYDEKRQKIKAGDRIRFTCVETGEEQTVKVIAIKLFRDFKELYASYEKTSLGYGEEEPADPADMEQYYPQEETERYGVVGIEIERTGVTSFYYARKNAAVGVARRRRFCGVICLVCFAGSLRTPSG